MKRWAFRRTMGVGLVLAAATLTGCDILDEGEAPTSARLIIDGGAGQAFNLVTSNDFTVVANSDTGETGEIILNEADTVLISAPINERYSLGSGVRFFIKVFRDQPLSEPINVKVLVGGTQRYNSTSALDGLTMEFVYTYR
jgi:hypothetical protein